MGESLERRKKYSMVPALIWTALMLSLFLMPSKDVPNTMLSNIPYFDKLVHSFLFAVFVILWIIAFRGRTKQSSLVVLANVIWIAVVLGLAVELIQMKWGAIERSFEWKDWVADLIGAFLGGAIYREIFKEKDKAAVSEGGKNN